MNKTIALDTNVLGYCHSNDELEKQEIATSLFAFYPVVSTQVRFSLCENYNFILFLGYIVNATQIKVRRARDGTKPMPNLFSTMGEKKDFEQLLLDF